MSAPLPNAFIGRANPPTPEDLASALGGASPHWQELLSCVAREHGADTHEWKCHSPKWGWSLRVLRKKRTIVWLSPANGAFNVLFILGEKAMAAAKETKLPAAVAQALATAPKYPEGTGVRLVVKSGTLVPALKKLAAIKVAN